MLLATKNGSRTAYLPILVDRLAVKADNRTSITEEAAVEVTHDEAVEDDGRRNEMEKNNISLIIRETPLKLLFL